MLGRPRLRKPVVAAAAALAVSFGGLLVGTAAPAMAATCGSGNGTTWALTHLGGNGNQQAVTTSSNWGGDNVCLYVPGTTNTYAAGFAVQNQPAAAYNGNVLAYPDSNIGCEGGYCSWQSGLPASVSSNPDPTVSWNYDTVDAAPDSMWDALIDSEFSASCSGSNPAFNANIGIYLDGSNSASKLGLASANLVVIDGLPWFTLHVRDVQGGIYDYKTEFVSTTPMASGISGLDVGAFYSWVQNNDSNWDYGSNYLPPTDCLQNIGTGFELWQDGYNLASYGTWITGLNTAASPSPSPSASATVSSTPTPSVSPTDSSTPDPTDSTPDPTDSSTPDPSASPTSS
ncbi:MAG TPA: hypothetical protein VHT94_07040 [Streptosporangiaceae bacterium]|nr:hypothetical protein [Streptosporangiaceae bacterium]